MLNTNLPGTTRKWATWKPVSQPQVPSSLVLSMPDTAPLPSKDITGSESSERAVILIFDAFGFRQPTLRGADLLAASVPCLIVMPDLFKGSPADPDWFPTDTEEKARALEKFKPKAYNATLVPTIIQSVADAKLKWPSVQAWGCFGLGWGGKVRIIVAAIATVPFC